MTGRDPDGGARAPDGRAPGPWPTEGETLSSARTIAGLVALVFASLMHLMVAAIMLVAAWIPPAWARGVMLSVWLLVGVLIVLWHRARPLVTLLLPFVGLGVARGLLLLGQEVLGW